MKLFFIKYYYTIKYWFQGQTWEEAKEYTEFILRAFNKELKIWKK